MGLLRRVGGGVAAGLLLLFVVSAFFPVLNPFAGAATTTSTTSTTTPPAGCTSQLHFYATDVSSNFNGPPVIQTDVPGQEAELHTRRCADPALVVEHAHVNQLPGFAELNGDQQFADKVRELAWNHELWGQTIKQLEDKEATAVASDETMSGSYDTLYMLDGVTDVPLIRKAQPDRPSFAVLRFTYADGSVVNFKLDCGFQPVGQFPNVPPVETPPPPHVPPPPSTTTTVCIPNGHENCGKDASTSPSTSIVVTCPDGWHLPRGGTSVSDCVKDVVITTTTTTAPAPPTTVSPPVTPPNTSPPTTGVQPH